MDGNSLDMWQPKSGVDEETPFGLKTRSENMLPPTKFVLCQSHLSLGETSGRWAYPAELKGEQRRTVRRGNYNAHKRTHNNNNNKNKPIYIYSKEIEESSTKSTNHRVISQRVGSLFRLKTTKGLFSQSHNVCFT